ncbi:MAG: phosphoglycerate kinase [Verrucomicrobiales bacterium]|nr:phosphoglycerate kinase [Verrucomicrobiales bacterium]MBV63256.1 phosphoglycerate kinase [Rickettsiales bacterium]|tara:strand:+ start:5003 stop:6202 length:1200 start_codon:yes stop_codon:yes gene_type:complete
MSKKTIRDINLQGRKVLVRCDFNVPLNKERQITDDTRIVGAIPTIKFLIEEGARVILSSHLGRPGGEKNSEYSLDVVANRLSELLSAEVVFVGDCIGQSVVDAVEKLSEGQVCLLENVRFYSEETENDADFANQLSSIADVYVNDAFGTAHRAHASTSGVTAYVQDSVMGFLLEKELKYLKGELKNPDNPFVVILGGKKVSDKIGVIKALIDKADTILIGGAMQYAFRKAQGYSIGESYVVDDDIPIAKELLDEANTKEVNLLLPADSLEADDFSNEANTNNIQPYDEGGSIREGWEGLDIGQQAIEEFSQVISSAKTILWNGPMGVFEIEAFSKGTKMLAEAIANSNALSIIGGGDSVTAVKKFGFADNVTFISTGGGASLELLEGKILPGVDSLDDI